MASAYCTYLKNLLLNYLHGVSPPAQPANVYVGLATSCNAAGTITGEPSGNGYARVLVDNDSATTWSASTVGSKTNANATIVFPQCTTTGWGALTIFFVSTASSGNTDTLYYGDLSPAITVNVGDTPSFATSQLTVTLT